MDNQQASEVDYIENEAPEDMIIVKSIKQMEINSKTKNATHPNFLNPIKMPQSKLEKKKTIIAMISNNINRRTIISKFCDLARQYLNDDDCTQDIVQFWQFNQARNFRPLDQKEILQWYTKQSFFHKVLNNFLRYACDPLQLYYVQPFVSDLCKAIKSCLQSKLMATEFMCFRGALMQDEELMELQNMKGQYVENSCFLSTSRSKVIANTFARNAIIQIRVKNDFIEHCQDLGFIQVYRFCHQFYQQQEVLFNLFCSFMVEDVVMNNEWPLWSVKLSYEPMRRKQIKLRRGEVPNLTQLQLINSTNYFKQYLKSNQIVILLQNKNKLKFALLYLIKYKQLCQQMQDKMSQKKIRQAEIVILLCLLKAGEGVGFFHSGIGKECKFSHGLGFYISGSQEEKVKVAFGWICRLIFKINFSFQITLLHLVKQNQIRDDLNLPSSQPKEPDKL